MRLTQAGVALVTLGAASWCAALITSHPAATFVALVCSSAMVIAFLTLPRPRIRATRTVDRTRLRESESLQETLLVETRSSGWSRIVLEEHSGPGLRPETPTSFVLRGANARRATFTVLWRAVAWGRHDVGPVKAHAQDWLGLIETTIEPAGVVNVRVHPSAISVGKHHARASRPDVSIGMHTVSMPGDGFEFFALRGYQPGDSIRRINWKASARADTTIVNQVSRENFARVLIVVDLREKETIGAIEESGRIRSGRVVSALLEHHERRKDQVQVIALSDKARLATHSRNPRPSEVLDALCDILPTGAASLDGALRDHLHLVRPRSPVYFVTSASLELELRSAILTARTLGAFPRVIAPEWRADGSERTIEIIESSRARALSEARALGVPVTEWRLGQSLEVALAAA